MRTSSLLTAGLTVISMAALSFAATPGTSLQDASAATGVQRRPGPTLVLRANDFDVRSFVPPRVSSEARPKMPTATFVVTYNGFSAEAENAFQAAVDVWSGLITSPVTIRVEANWAPLDEDTLGTAGSQFVWRDFPGALNPGVWYQDALADVMRGFDLGGGDFDIVANFNSDRSDWYFGTDGNTPFGRFDLMSVVLHELCHGLGFSGSGTVAGSQGSWGLSGFPVGYDLFTEDAGGTPVTDTAVYPNPSAVLAGLLQGNSLFWGGPMAVAVNSGTRPRLYAPASWEGGSSYSHLDESTYSPGNANSLMTPSLSSSEAIHDPGPIALCMFQDIGWTTSQDCSSGGATNTYWVAAAARATGVGGSQWRTRLGLYNRSLSQATVEIRYHRSGVTSSTMLSIPAGNQIVIDDIVGLVGSTGSGSLEIISNVPLIVGSRTYNLSASGTFGQYLDGVVLGGGTDAGETVWLSLLEESVNFRTNIGFTNTGSGSATVTVTLYNSTGAVVRVFSVTIGGGLNKQENQPYGSTVVTGGYASVRVVSGSGLIIYGSVIDNLTGDPTTIPPKP